MGLAIGSRSRHFASFTERVIVAHNFPGFGMENCAVTARGCKVDVRPHCQGCVCVNHAVVSKVWVVDILYLFNVIAVAVELDGIAVNNDIPVAEQTLRDLVDEKRFNLGRCILGYRCRLFVNCHLPAPVSKLWYQSDDSSPDLVCSCSSQSVGILLNRRLSSALSVRRISQRDVS